MQFLTPDRAGIDVRDGSVLRQYQETLHGQARLTAARHYLLEEIPHCCVDREVVFGGIGFRVTNQISGQTERDIAKRHNFSVAHVSASKIASAGFSSMHSASKVETI
jgi:hypothetical protein